MPRTPSSPTRPTDGWRPVADGAIPLDRAWLAAHPRPEHPFGTDKNSRGRVVLCGGAASVPGALRLTGEAALRAGAGKLRMATVMDAALPLGMMVPEAASIGLPTDADGEIAAAAVPILIAMLDECDVFLLGPGMGERTCAARLVEGALAEPREGLSVVLDAAAVACAGQFADVLRRHDGRLALTPHHGEMAHLLDIPAEDIVADPAAVVRRAADRFGAAVALKSGETHVAAPDGTLLLYPGGGVGLATGGSGDVLAGLVAGLMARGADPLTAVGWGVWLHGEAGRSLAARLGPIGFLARELLPEVPGLMAS